MRSRALKLLVLGALAGVGGWWWHARAPRALTAAEVLSTIPPATGTQADKAVAAWVERARLDPRSVLAWTNLGDALMQKARETMDTEYYGRAEAAFEKALALSPENEVAIAGLSWVAGSRHEFERSIEWANKALKVDRNSQAAYGLLGDAAVELGDYEGAFRHYQRMLDLRPDLSSYSRGAHLLFLTGNTLKATWLMQKAIAAGATHAENTAWCRAQLALMHWHTGALVAAEQVLEAGLVRTPSNYHLLAAMGRVKIARKDYAAAIENYRKAIGNVPHHEVVVALGDVYALSGNRAEAERQYALVEAIHAANAKQGVRGSLELARFYTDHDRKLPDALTIAEAEYKATPNVFAADVLAWAYYKNGRFADAKTTIEKALSQKTPDANLLFHAGMIHDKFGNRVEAQRFLYQAISLNPNFHPLQAPIAAEALARLGRQ
jgi:tetratricopeptide (TPR) repeat protein